MGVFPDKRISSSSAYAVKRAQRALTWLIVLVAANGAQANDLGASISVWSDSDGTTVITPRVRSKIQLEEDTTYVDVAYAADIWTSASIDIRTAATKPFTEQRDEITAGVTHEMEDAKIGFGYRYSAEPDYLAQGGSASLAYDLAGGSATLEWLLGVGSDSVGRSGDPTFDRSLTTVNGRMAFTQILSSSLLMQLTYEGGRAWGFQSSPYRFVGIGGDGLCGGTASFCMREAHPDQRTRHALVARAAYGLLDTVAVSGAYRLYLDDWGVMSHTILGQIAWQSDETSVISLRYRLYMQEAASFYRSVYEELPPGTRPYLTRDRELSDMTSQRFTLSYERTFDVLSSGPVMHATLAASGVFFDYKDFVGLDAVQALELTLAATFEL